MLRVGDKRVSVFDDQLLDAVWCTFFEELRAMSYQPQTHADMYVVAWGDLVPSHELMTAGKFITTRGWRFEFLPDKKRPNRIVMISTRLYTPTHLDHVAAVDEMARKIVL